MADTTKQDDRVTALEEELEALKGQLRVVAKDRDDLKAILPEDHTPDYSRGEECRIALDGKMVAGVVVGVSGERNKPAIYSVEAVSPKTGAKVVRNHLSAGEVRPKEKPAKGRGR